MVPEDRRATKARTAIRRFAPVNANRVYRLMTKHGLLLERHTGCRGPREHEGQVARIRSWVATIAGISGEMIRDMMVPLPRTALRLNPCPPSGAGAFR